MNESIPQSSLPKIPREPAQFEERRRYAERAAGRSLPHLCDGLAPAPESAAGNVENLVGWAAVPLGLAGPLVCDTSLGRVERVFPLATTEGALVASVSRGMRLMTEAGTARSRVVHEGLTQNPMLLYVDAEAALVARDLARSSHGRFAKIVAETTQHGALKELRAQVLGRRLVLSLVFTTGDAIGINMAARATELCMQDLALRTDALEAYVHGQDVEKRANGRALVEGRGRSVVSDVTIPRAILERITRTTPEALARIQATYRVGFAELGTHNWTVQSANVLAALYIACGQDVAYVTESATGHLDLDVTTDGDLYASVSLPSILCGSVGGGSGQGTAAESLALLDCVGADRGNHLAELIGAAVLAGDLSLMAAFCAGEFVAAHERLGRNRPSADGEEQAR